MSFDLQFQGHAALLEFDHGKANEMGSEQLRAFEALPEQLGDARALVSFSRRRSKRGTPIFISGANVTERVGWTRDQVAGHVRWQRATLARVRRLPLFHIAVVNGVALGWGTEYLICCDYRIATEDATFALPETGLGILPGAGGTSELWTLIGLPQTLRLGMTGERISAAEALRIGLVQEVVADVDAGLARAQELAAGVARKSPTAVAAFKQGLLEAVGLSVDDRVEVEAQAYEHCLDSGQAAIGRENFSAIRSGGEVPWGPRIPWER
jgi:enoyl-CoA hydratase/carnithine racemase